MATASLVRLFVVNCVGPDCENHELLYTADRKEAERTARELDWYQSPRHGWLCPHCAPPRRARGGKAVQA